ncbi:hypothetical protein [Wolbachia endosymbiont (group A) of Bibio marci]|uniref:hypothetical protein n=1 Tax=Wolbachia endosymbiont (group A) of Bibio marci TaxID=2953987 RepID=UPI00223038E8|nr:hypothetical protein [Wolbachia endosymbiont (group A) of Bibio marci]
MPSRQFTEPGPSGLSWSQSGPSSWKGANPVGANPWAQQTNPCLSQGTSENKWISSMQFTKPEPSGLSCSQSGASSSRGAGKNMPTGSSSWCLPPSTSSLTTRNDPISSNLGIFADPPEDTENICSMKEKQQVTKEKEEEKLSKALLYTFNLMNYTLDSVYTNFFAKDGKIVSLLHDNVDREEYLQAVIDYVVEEYYETEKEARESCDFDEFPFKFLPDPDYEKNQNDCEKNSRKTVVANISSGALSNLEKLFIYGYEEEVKIEKIDINIIKEAVKSKKDRLVDLKVKKGIEREGGYYNRIKHREAATACYPDENALEDIPIIKDKGGYCLDRTFNDWETKLPLKEQQCTKGTSVAKKGKLEDNKDSGYSSGFVTDAENVSSKAEATTSGISGYESMDCENTGKRLPKRKSQSPVGEDSLRKSPKRDSSPLSMLKSLSLSSPSHQTDKSSAIDLI